MTNEKLRTHDKRKTSCLGAVHPDIDRDEQPLILGRTLALAGVLLHPLPERGRADVVPVPAIP